MKNKTIDKIQLFFIGAVVLFTSCITPFQPEIFINDTESVLVVEGEITNEVAPFKVRLTESVSVYSDPNVLNNEQPLYGADVQIFDDHGNIFQLYEEENGWYETQDKQLRGVVGNTYKLTITIPDGLEYESSPMLMQDAPDIEKVYYKEIQKTIFDEAEPYTENWLDILVDSDAPVKKGIYLRWEFEETWKFEMPSYVLVDHGMGPGAPPPSMETVDIEYEKIACWVSEPSRNILVESSISYNDNNIRNFVLQTIGSNSDRLNIKYSILVKQYAIDRDLYTYFKRLRETNKETDGIYSKIPGQVYGNITCCNNGKKALGYFIASDVKSKRIFIDHFDNDIERGSAYSGCGWTTAPPPGQTIYLYGTYLENGVTREVWSTNKYCTDCRVRGTNVKPDFWE